MRSFRCFALVALVPLCVSACGSSSKPGPADAALPPEASGEGGQTADGADGANVADAADGPVAADDAGEAGTANGDDGGDGSLGAPDAAVEASCTGVDAMSDPQNCGGCGVSCGASGVCSLGRCVTVLADVAISGYAKGVAVDANGVYVTSANPQCVFEVPLGGGTPMPLLSPAPTPSVTGSGAVALAGTVLYWTTGGGQQVFSVPTAGGAATPVSTTENDPEAITSDGTHAYWTDSTRIRYASAGAASPMTLPVTSEAGTPFDTPTGIAVDNAFVYWSNRGGHGTATIWRVDKTAGGAAKLVQSGADPIQGLALDATNAYFTTFYGTGGVYSVPVGGGPATALSTSETSPSKIVSDASALYWLDGLRVRKLLKGGGATAVTLVSYAGALQAKVAAGGSFTDLAADATYLYFTQSSNGGPFVVYRVAKN
jgi:hypothetical protein